MHLASMKILLTLDGESSLGEGGPSPAAWGGRGRQGGDGMAGLMVRPYTVERDPMEEYRWSGATSAA